MNTDRWVKAGDKLRCVRPSSGFRVGDTVVAMTGEDSDNRAMARHPVTNQTVALVWDYWEVCETKQESQYLEYMEDRLVRQDECIGTSQGSSSRRHPSLFEGFEGGEP